MGKPQRSCRDGHSLRVPGGEWMARWWFPVNFAMVAVTKSENRKGAILSLHIVHFENLSLDDFYIDFYYTSG
jgi:hypothetical protein